MKARQAIDYEAIPQEFWRKAEAAALAKQFSIEELELSPVQIQLLQQKGAAIWRDEFDIVRAKYGSDVTATEAIEILQVERGAQFIWDLAMQMRRLPL